MIAQSHRPLRHLSRKVLDAIAEGLKEIEGYFELEVFPANHFESPEEASQQELESQGEKGEEDEDDEEEEYDEGEGSSGTAIFDREDVEVAVDLFISHLVQVGVLRKAKSGAQLSFSEVFEKFFGEEHAIVERAQSFEEHIEGYFDSVGYEDMKIAYEELAAIQEMINREMNPNAKN